MSESLLARHEQFLSQLIEDAIIPAAVIRVAMNYALFPGGKRIRPILIYQIGEILEVDVRVLDVISASVELTHCYSLIHDDLPAMDNDDMRRGKPSCHKAYDEATAILVGDGMQALAIEILITHLTPLLGNAQLLAITLELVKASGISGMVSGQSLDLSELAKASVTEEQLKEIHRLKTGRLICACAEMVLAASIEVDGQSQQALRSYTNHIGLAFQMQDDYLDCYAPTETLGKGRSSDFANHKTTFATLYSKHELADLIDNHYQKAINTLSHFGNKAKALIALTQQLQARSLLINA